MKSPETTRPDGVPASLLAKESPAYDRRSEVRLRTVYRIARIRTPDDEGLARIHNISDEGMMLELGFPVAKGSLLHVALTEEARVLGRVAWNNGTHCGIELLEPIDSADLLKRIVQLTSEGRFRPHRLAVPLAGLVESEHGICRVRVEDLSQRGMKLTNDGGFRPGLHVKVRTAGGLERKGVVRWTGKEKTGIMLLEPLPWEHLGSLKSLCGKVPAQGHRDT